MKLSFGFEDPIEFLTPSWGTGPFPIRRPAWSLASYSVNSTQENDMRPLNDNAPAKTIEQAKADLLDNVRMAIASINDLTTNLERLRARIKNEHRSVQ